MSRFRIFCLAAVLTVATLLTGCLPLSVSPIYDDASLVYDAGLIGVWGNPDDPDGETWEFRPAGEMRYQLVIRQGDTLRIDPEHDGLFEARLARVGDEMFLDLFPEEPEAGSDLYKMHIVPGHSIWRASLQGHVLVLGLLDGEALEKLIESGDLEIAHVDREGVIVLTDSTARIQAALMAHADALFADEETLKRLQ